MGKTLNDNPDRKLFAAVIIACYIIFGTFMVIGTFYDLEIDKAVFNFSSSFSHFMERWGMLAAYFNTIIAFSAVVACYHKCGEFADIAITVFPFLSFLKKSEAGEKTIWVLHKGVYAALLYGVYIGAHDLINYCIRRVTDYKFAEYLTEVRGMNGTAADFIFAGVCCALGAVTVLACIGIRKKMSPKVLKAFEFMAVVGLLMALMSGIIDTLKDHFTRIRFREMIAVSHGIEDGEASSALPKEWINDTDFSYFGRWYHVGKDDGTYLHASSFPSGHTAGASYSMLLVPLFCKLRAKKGIFMLASLIGIGYMVTMAVTRLVVGAHYLTDVSAASIIMLTAMLIGYFITAKFESIYYANKASE